MEFVWRVGGNQIKLSDSKMCVTGLSVFMYLRYCTLMITELLYLEIQSNGITSTDEVDGTRDEGVTMISQYQEILI